MSSEPVVVGYCRQCGKALDASNVRAAHGTIYCEEHVPPMATPMNPAMPPPMTPPRMDNPQTVPPLDASPYANPYTAPRMAPPVAGSLANNDVSPGLAFGLGLIPGVGAIYNGQYAKGIVHVIIVGVMISILSSGAANGFEPLMGLMLAGFWAYMCFEAFHTAQRRQQGLSVDEFSSLIPMRGSSRFPAAPVILIALGVIFLLDNLNILDLRHLLRYWPVLLIGLGAYMLFLRMGGAAGNGNGNGGER
jgi:Domain of unknown function (DUF5668)